MNNRFCFVISPIGEPDSIERKQADTFLDLIREIGELHNLEVKRADEIVGTSDINTDVVEKVQNADLCLIDLTGLNPNVMYEFGMRYQTGLPYIVCAKEKTVLPFDTISRRTIFYGDLNNTTENRKTKKAIRSFIDLFEKNDYKSVEAISSKDLYDMLQTIIEKLDNLNRSPTVDNSSNNIVNFTTNGVDDLLRQLDPSEAFHYAYSTNQVKLAEDLLEYCRNQPFEYFFNKLCALSSLGSKKASTELESYLSNSIDTEPFSNILVAIGSLVSCYNRQDSEKAHMKEMEQFIEKALDRAQTNKERASILNQKERLLAGAKMFEEAQEIAKKTTELDDEEPSYFYNYATVLRHLGQFSLALTNAKRAVDISSDEDADHLALVCELLKESNDPINLEMFESYMRRLEKKNPLKARLIRLK